MYDDDIWSCNQDWKPEILFLQFFLGYGYQIIYTFFLISELFCLQLFGNQSTMVLFEEANTTENLINKHVDKVNL